METGILVWPCVFVEEKRVLGCVHVRIKAKC